MSTKTVDVRDPQTRLADLVMLAREGNEVIIAEDHKPVARLVLISEPNQSRVPGLSRGVIWMSEDFFLKHNINTEIYTNDGQKIYLEADGVGLPRKNSSIADLRENVTLFTSAKDYTWINTLQIWGIGTVDFAKKIIHLVGYSV
jgi:antitoxin (DNA-binding transcriptional repressor) of toxin-antitoxin stability system